MSSNVSPEEETEWRNFPKQTIHAWQCITKEKRNSVVMLMGHQIETFMQESDMKLNILLSIRIYFKTICSYTFAHLQIGWCASKGVLSWVTRLPVTIKKVKLKL